MYVITSAYINKMSPSDVKDNRNGYLSLHLWVFFFLFVGIAFTDLPVSNCIFSQLFNEGSFLSFYKKPAIEMHQEKKNYYPTGS